MTGTSARLGLPMLHAGQAQKEVAHNEALALLDLVVQAGVADMGLDAPPADPAEGRAWIVGSEPTGAWAGRARHLAGWTGGGWRFVAPFEGMTVWVAARRLAALHVDGAWIEGEIRAGRVLVGGVQVLGARRSAIGEPTGGNVVDSEARATLSAVLDALRAHGLVAS